MSLNIDKCQVVEWWSIIIVAIPAFIGAEDRVGAQGLDLRNGTVAGFDWGARGREHHGDDLARAMLGTGVSERPSDRQSAGRQRKHQLLDRTTAEFIVPPK